MSHIASPSSEPSSAHTPNDRSRERLSEDPRVGLRSRGDPRTVLEPCPRDRGAVTSLIADIHQRSDVAMLIVEQDVALALRLADRGYLLETGRIVKDGDSATLLNDPAIRESSLGI